MKSIDDIIKEKLAAGGKRNRPHKGIGVGGKKNKYACGGINKKK